MVSPPDCYAVALSLSPFCPPLPRAIGADRRSAVSDDLSSEGLIGYPASSESHGLVSPRCRNDEMGRMVRLPKCQITAVAPQMALQRRARTRVTHSESANERMLTQSFRTGSGRRSTTRQARAAAASSATQQLVPLNRNGVTGQWARPSIRRLLAEAGEISMGRKRWPCRRRVSPRDLALALRQLRDSTM